MSEVDRLLAAAEDRFGRAFLEEARVLAEAALKLDRENTDAMGLIAEVHRLAGRSEAAIGMLRRAVDLAPDEPWFHATLADLYRRSGRADMAVRYTSAALSAMGDNADAYHAHGVTLTALGRDGEAMDAFRSALSLDPGHARAHIELAMAHLRAGEYSAAWPHFEERHRLQPPADVFGHAPRWDGSEIESLLVVDEGGHGDAVWAARFLRGLKPRAASVTLAVRANLMTLFSQLEGIDRIVDLDGDLPEADAMCALLSLPAYCDGVEDFKPARLYRDFPGTRWDALVAEGGERLRVGIIWSGSVDYANNHNRAAPLSAFAPLIEIPDVQCYSLQKGPPREELLEANLGSLIIDTDDFDFAETAALVDALDLIVMTDTAVAHIAGSLGKPTWLLLDHQPYWYFHGSGERTIWYPSLRLFRQTRPGDWAGVVAKVTAALAEQSAARQTG